MSPLEQRIRKLEDDLYLARTLVLELTGPELHDLLYPPTDLDTPRAAHAWLTAAMGKVLALAEVLTIEEPLCTSQRAVCPLCRGDANDYNRAGPGYKYPEGLRRHLLGANISTQCPVSKIALDLALESARIHAMYPR
ncbi:hypothetical protein [Dyella lipolytica]|uniref:Transposase n=1 Tax=Dyella lipolytica TaxID=1867835 RepID=A0ABW8J0A1_9GAMM|nr:hypothetical protein [Dyella lipolytica]